VLGKKEQQPAVNAYRLIDLLVDFLSALNVMGSKPAANALVLKVGMKALRKFLVFGRIADEAGVKLDRLV
jgi:hypothetical protein